MNQAVPTPSSQFTATIIAPDLYPVGQEFSRPDREKANTALRAASAGVFPFTKGAA